MRVQELIARQSRRWRCVCSSVCYTNVISIWVHLPSTLLPVYLIVKDHLSVFLLFFIFPSAPLPTNQLAIYHRYHEFVSPMSLFIGILVHDPTQTIIMCLAIGSGNWLSRVYVASNEQLGFFFFFFFLFFLLGIIIYLFMLLPLVIIPASPELFAIGSRPANRMPS